MRHVVRLLLLTLLLLAGRPELRASLPKTRVGNFFAPTCEPRLENTLQVPETRLDNPLLYGEAVSGQTLWTKFDPEGLEGYYPRTQYERDGGTAPDVALLHAAGAWANDHPRTMGGVKAAGSVLEMGVGVAGAMAPTGVTQLLGGAAIAHGGDGFQAGVRQMWNGAPTETFTQQAITGVASAAGASPATAQTIGAVGDGLLGTALTLGISGGLAPVKSAAAISSEAGNAARGIGGAPRDCVACTADHLADMMGGTSNTKLLRQQLQSGKLNVTSTEAAVSLIEQHTNLVAGEPVSWGAADPGHYAVFGDGHVVYGYVPPIKAEVNPFLYDRQFETMTALPATSKAVPFTLRP